jgi:hypothetical protein
MPFDPDNPFGPADPSQWQWAGALPRIIVHPKPPLNAPDLDGIDDWFVPTGAPADTSYLDDWFVPTPSTTPGTGQFAPGAQTAIGNPGRSNTPAPWPDPFAAYWSLIPAGGVGATAWDPPTFPGNSPNNPSTPSWPPAQSPPVASPKIPIGGLLGALANLGSWSPVTGNWIPSGGLLGTLAHLGSSGPDSGGALPPLPQPPLADAQTVTPVGRRPLADYSTGEILGDAAKSFGVGVGQFGIQGAGFPGDVREMIANGAQRAADYFAPGSAPNAGSKVSDFLASYPFLAGPTSSQLQSAVESYTGPFYQPKTIVGDYARTAGEFVPGALLAPEGSLAVNALRYGLLPALSSETARATHPGHAGGALGALRRSDSRRRPQRIAGPALDAKRTCDRRDACRRRTIAREEHSASHTKQSCGGCLGRRSNTQHHC